jgi:heme ABC exporter ATP-binding subunit CcmA
VLAIRLQRRFGGVAVLAGVDLTVVPGEVIVLFGPNGAGKTTLLRVLATLLRPSAGRLHLFGDDATRHPPAALRRIGYVGHESACYPDLTGAENLTFYARLYELEDAAARVDAALVWAQLGAAARRPARTYSRGMWQRLALARALLHAPALVLLDEPFSGLDPDGTALLTDKLRALGAAGAAVVFSTHDIGAAATVASRAVLLRRGQIAWQGQAPDAAAAYRHGAETR